MATSKILTPTNVTIQIPEFTDQPDQRVNTNCIDKEADAINALKTSLDTLSGKIKYKRIFNSSKVTSGDISLTDDYTDFDVLILVSMTNSEYFTDVFPVAFKSISDTIKCSHSGTPAAGGYTYNSSITYTLKSDTKKITIANEYNNGNWQLGVRAVYGLKCS